MLKKDGSKEQMNSGGLLIRGGTTILPWVALWDQHRVSKKK